MQPPPSRSTSGSMPPFSSTLARMHTQISALFHGTSVHTSGPFTSSCGSKSTCSSEPIRSHGRLYIPEPMARPPFHSRSPTSTRSMIDPTSSTASSRRPVTAHSYLRLITSPALALQSTPASPTRLFDTPCEGLHPAGGSGGIRRHRRRRRHGTCDRIQTSSTIKRASVRRRVYGCLGSGISLAVVLTICTLRSIPVYRVPVG